MTRGRGGTWRCARSLGALGALALSTACAAHAGDDTTDSDSQPGAGCPGGKSSAAQCPGKSELPTSDAVIDDMEDADALLAPTQGRNGGWWTAGDTTSGASIVPERSELTGELVAPEPIPSARCGSKFAMHVTGQGFRDWGALLGADLVFEPSAEGTALPYDAGAWTGIEFWARIGDTSTDQVRFAVSDVNNEPPGGLCVEDPGPEQCYDSFGVYLRDLGEEWKRFRVPFAGLTQRGFGLPADAVATSALYSVQFNFDPGAIFDLWVDDVAFY